MLATVGAYAQGNDIADTTEATNIVISYFDSGTKLIYAVGAVDGLQYVGVEKNYTAVKAQTLITSSGIQVSIPELKLDIVTYKDRWGKTYSYPIGVREEELLFKAGKASKVWRTLPAYLRKKVKSLYFFQQDCPTNPFWEIEYKSQISKRRQQMGQRQLGGHEQTQKQNFTA